MKYFILSCLAIILHSDAAEFQCSYYKDVVTIAATGVDKLVFTPITTIGNLTPIHAGTVIDSLRGKGPDVDEFLNAASDFFTTIRNFRDTLFERVPFNVKTKLHFDIKEHLDYERDAIEHDETLLTKEACHALKDYLPIIDTANEEIRECVRKTAQEAIPADVLNGSLYQRMKEVFEKIKKSDGKDADGLRKDIQAMVVSLKIARDSVKIPTAKDDDCLKTVNSKLEKNLDHILEEIEHIKVV